MATTRHALVAVMGATGSGKSSFIAGISGANAKVCRTLHSGTQSIDQYSFDLDSHHRVTLVDTPGFDDTFNSDHEILRKIFEWLKTQYHDKQLLSGILYLQPITKNRIEGSTRRNLVLFEKLCGPQNLQNVLLVTTFWNDVESHIGVQREKELLETEGLWKELKDRGASTERMSRDYDRYRNILRRFSRAPTFALQIQEEMRHGKTLSQTLAGLHLNEEVNRLQQEHEQNTSRIEEKFSFRLRQQKSRVQLQRDRLKAQEAEWAEREKKRQEKEKQELEERLRAMQAAHERERVERQNRLDMMAKQAAERIAKQEQLHKEETERKYHQVLRLGKLKFKTGMVQQQRIETQLDVLRMGAQANLTRIRVDGIFFKGRGLINTNDDGSETFVTRSILNMWCDNCLKAPGTQKYFACEKTPCALSDDPNFTALLCESCWNSGDWKLLHGRSCDFKKYQVPSNCRRAQNPNGLLCNVCRSSNSPSGEMEGLYFHCHICDEDDFDLCLQCVLNGYSCRNRNHVLQWGIQKIDLGTSR